MECLVPLDTANYGGTPVVPVPPAGSFTLSQNLAAGAMTVSFNLSSYGFTTAPTNILPTLIASGANEPLISLYSIQWNATTFSANLSAPTPDGTYAVKIQIFP